MMAFKIATQGVFVTNSFNVGSSINCKAYTVLGDDGKYYITLINKDTTNEAYVKVTGLPIVRSTQIIRLSGGGDPTATAVTLGNTTANSQGIWTNASTETAGYDVTSYQIKVPKASIAILVVGNTQVQN